MLAGGFVVAGAALYGLGHTLKSDMDTAAFFRKWSPRIVLIFGVAQFVLGFWVLASQPEAVRQGVTASLGMRVTIALWLITMLGVVAVGAMAALRGGKRAPILAWVCPLVAVLNIAVMVVFRDAIRDVSLAQFGYNVWEREVVTNWSTIIVFLVLFVAALASAVWLGLVGARSRKGEHSHA
jgi:hypothetical protein